ncbi:unnamed protein product [Schistosoma turkestanicum]|nr:unnamed protein product [Schistosoma turkestanicum]
MLHLQCGTFCLLVPTKKNFKENSESFECDTALVGLGKSRGKSDISGRTSPVNLKSSKSDELNKDQQDDKKEAKSLASLQKGEEPNVGKKSKDTSEKANTSNDKPKETIKTDKKIDEKQTSSAETTNKSTTNSDNNTQAPQGKSAASVRLVDLVSQGSTDQNNQKNPSSTLINFLTSPIQTIKSNRAPSPTMPANTKLVDEVKEPEIDTKSSELKEKQNKNPKDETNKIQSKNVEIQPNINVEQKKGTTSVSQPETIIKTQEEVSVPTSKPQDDKVSETQNKSNNITKSVSEIPVKTTETNKPQKENQINKPEVGQPNTNYLVPSNIPEPGTQLKLRRNGVVARSVDEQLKPYQPKIASKQPNPPDLNLTSDKGVNRSVIIGQREHEKYDESQRINLKNLDPCRLSLFSAIDLKHSGFANAEDIENCWNKLGVPDVENLLKYLGFPKHGMINLDHLTQSLHEALELNTYDEPSVLAGIRSMNLELYLTEALKNAYGKEIEKLETNLTEEREMILRYFHQQLNEIRQKMDILLGQKEVEIRQVQQKLDKTIQSSNEIEIKNKDVEFLLQTEDRFLSFITNLSDIMEAEIKQCEMGREQFNHIFSFNEKIKKKVDQVKSQAENGNHFKRLKDSIQILKDYSQLLQIIVIKFAGIQRHTQFIISQEKEKNEKLEKTLEIQQTNLSNLQTTYDNISRQNQKLFSENEELQQKIQSKEATIKNLQEENNQLSENYKSVLKKLTANSINKNNSNNISTNNVSRNNGTYENDKSNHDNNTIDRKQNNNEHSSPDPNHQHRESSMNPVYMMYPEKNSMSPYHMTKDQLAMQQYQNDLEETIRKQAKQIRQLKNTASKYRPNDATWTEMIATRDQ